MSSAAKKHEKWASLWFWQVSHWWTGNEARERLQEISSCSCYNVLLGIILLLLNKICIPFSVPCTLRGNIGRILRSNITGVKSFSGFPESTESITRILHYSVTNYCESAACVCSSNGTWRQRHTSSVGRARGAVFGAGRDMCLFAGSIMPTRKLCLLTKP